MALKLITVEEHVVDGEVIEGLLKKQSSGGKLVGDRLEFFRRKALLVGCLFLSRKTE